MVVIRDPQPFNWEGVSLDLERLLEWVSQDLNRARLLLLGNATEKCSSVVHDGDLVQSHALLVLALILTFTIVPSDALDVLRMNVRTSPGVLFGACAIVSPGEADLRVAVFVFAFALVFALESTAPDPLALCIPVAVPASSVKSYVRMRVRLIKFPKRRCFRFLNPRTDVTSS